MPVRTLLLDNYDSYTFNVYQLLGQINGASPEVLRNDEIDWTQLSSRLAAGEFDNIVISPGPGTPACAGDVGICRRVFEEAADVPVLGVCLGLQALAVAHGATVCHAPYPVHGNLSAVTHNAHPLFRSIPSGSEFSVVRYHSLAVDTATLPACLEPIAWARGVQHSAIQPVKGSAQQSPAAGAAAGIRPCKNGGSTQLHVQADSRASCAAADAAEPSVLMGLAHRERPHYAVQFHPESVATEYGIAVLQNFRDLTLQHLGLPPAPPLLADLRGPPGSCMPPAPWKSNGNEPLEVLWRRLPDLLAACGGSANIFQALHGADPLADTFWLDSAATDRARFSYLGGRSGPLWQRLTYHLQPGAAAAASGSLHIEDADGVQTVQQVSLWDFLETTCRQRQCRISPNAAAALPFDFWGGYVGYLGYELKAQCDGSAAHQSETPDAALFCVDRFIVADHREDAVYVVSLAERGRASSEASAGSWLDATAASISALAASAKKACSIQNGVGHAATANGVQHGHSALGAARHCNGASSALDAELQPRHSKQQYLDNVQECLQALRDGESYELCLTTALSGPAARGPWACYQALRRLNPAPYGAWLSFGAGGPQVCCSSPERFLRGGRGRTLEARPIKGTAPRSADPAEDATLAAALAASTKDRAENLMIVDLLRNDLGQVCELGSVHVPGLMEVESFATVHQLVSTVRGLRRQDASMVQAIRAAFPGGSMTGAPKLRSMQILDRLEGGPRGIYSGCIGFLGFNDTFDLNIVIRTAVFHGGRVTIGAGGAIVVASDPEGEHEEMQLKAHPLMRAVGAA